MKSAAEGLAVASGATRAARRLRRGQAVVLAYHNVVPDVDQDAGQRTLHVRVARFRRQLDRLVETHDVVSLTALVDGSAWDRRSVLPMAAITFDDAYSGAVNAGLREVVARGLPATVFVSPGRLGGQCFWWDLVAEARDGTVPGDLMTWALEERAGDQARILEALSGGGEVSSDLPASLRSATEGELAHAADRPGVTLASHGWSHRNMVSLAHEDLEWEMRRPMAWLDERWDSATPLLAYPYGSSSPQVENRAARAGYAAAFRISGGWVTGREENVLALSRVNVPAGLSLRGFEVRTAGLWPPR